LVPISPPTGRKAGMTARHTQILWLFALAFAIRLLTTL
jgi:hypothetical protein